MKFLLDTQVPKKLSLFLIYRGYNSLYTLAFPHQNRSKESKLNRLYIEEKRMLVSKDTDIIESLLISDKLYKLLYINTRNITNKSLQELFMHNLDQCVSLLEKNRFVELTSENIMVNG